MNTELLELRQKIDKLLSDIEYDKFEMQRLRSQIEYILQINVDTCNKKTIIDTLTRFGIWRATNASNKFRKEKYKEIRIAIEDNCDDCLIGAINYNADLFTLHKETADNRYEVKLLLDTPGSNLAIGTIVNAYRQLEKELLDLTDIAIEIKNYLDKKYLKERILKR